MPPRKVLSPVPRLCLVMPTMLPPTAPLMICTSKLMSISMIEPLHSVNGVTTRLQQLQGSWLSSRSLFPLNDDRLLRMGQV